MNCPNMVSGRPRYGTELCVVSPRTPDGDILKYLNKHPGVNREPITRVHVKEHTENPIPIRWSELHIPVLAVSARRGPPASGRAYDRSAVMKVWFIVRPG